VVNEGSNSVSVVDAGTNQITATIPTGGNRAASRCCPAAYVANLDSGTATVLNLAD
jgi:DNA-binding beta-propeller fold protein YncE